MANIFKVPRYTNTPVFVVTQEIYDTCAANTDYSGLNLIVGTNVDAQNILSQEQQKLFDTEASIFTICSVFVNGNDSTWREVMDTDPEETPCQVFNTITGQHIFANNKTEGAQVLQDVKNQYLVHNNLDVVIELDTLPTTKK
jgi:hypothetical protein